METNVKRAEGVSSRVMTTTLYNFWSNKEKKLVKKNTGGIPITEYTV
jgi:hypothetical protein